MLQRAPTGVPWSIIPFPKATTAEQEAEQLNICWRATNEVDRICNQPLRATLDVEEEVGPEFRLTVRNGIASMLVSRWPVVSIVGGQCSPATALPPSWTPIPASAIRARPNLIGEYGTSAPGASGAGPAQIHISAGYVNWYNGREGFRVQVGYINGWPHAALTANAAAGATSLQVDDVTGYTGASAFVYDDANTEVIQVTSVTATNPVTVMGQTVPAGPGTVTLTTPTQFAHAAGVVVSSLPQDVSLAAIYLAAAQVLEAGATSVQMKNLGGGRVSSSGGISQFRTDAHRILAAYARFL